MKTFKPVLPLAMLLCIFTFNTSKAIDPGNKQPLAKQNQTLFSAMKYFPLKHLHHLSTGKLTVVKALNPKLQSNKSNAVNYVRVYLQEPSYQSEEYSVSISNGSNNYTFDTAEFQRGPDGNYDFGYIAPGVYTIDISVEGDEWWFGADINFNDSNNNTVDETVDEVSMPANDIVYYNQDIGDVVGNFLTISMWKDEE
ncbi:hypothetical protein [Mucilaginibacter sp. L196]|uniref:hypothetical protein n=1 Tax=Mucilaginibacter sp. L196 TaxID=1641870 RepID=UPI00131D467E|nr:hypothetical protein [Mucilaginibacter sp. L196]